MFALSGPKLRPLEVTEKLGIQPDYYHGADVKDIENMTISSHWQLNSKLGPEFPVLDHIWNLLKTLAPVRKSLKEFTESYESTIYVSVEFASEFTKGVVLDKRTMLLLGELGVNLEIIPWDLDGTP
ncbi:PF14106 domain protein [Leptospira meyeri serovar Hardjo str. Went 5]|nr:PF14106 domain protein [Leptospira meyeri serovar Hardjo str. Went 5]